MDKYLYLIINILSFSIPFIYSFERKRIYFIQYWKTFFAAIILVAIPFIIWDSVFAANGFWGFNTNYLIGLDILHLPIEEWMFFLLIPFASNFIHYALFYFFPQPKLGIKTSFFLSVSLMVIALTIALFNTEKAYTFLSFGTFGLLMLCQVIYRFEVFRRYIVSFVVILIPFYIVNSWLTGFFTDQPIVWYNDAENLGLRAGTIPIEDFFYCFTLLYASVLLFEKWNTAQMNSEFILHHD